MSASTAAGFLDLIEKSGLLTAEQLGEVFANDPPDDPEAIADALVRANRLTPYQAKQLRAGKHRGFFLGPYKILRPIGQGGMGTVFLGEHTSLGRKVALKVLAADKAKDQLALDRFQREARAAAALDHPNIVRLHDISQGAGVHFLVMEFVSGTDLQTLMGQTGPLHYAQAAQYVAQAAAGLHHAHERGFVHRDIKPANLILAKDGTVKILDMGLARSFVDDKDNLTAVQAEGEIAGTVDFLSPEQALNQPLDERSDIYSLGATFYALVTGHPPFAGTTAQKLAQHQMKDPPDASRKLNGRVPPALSAVIARMMSKRKTDRYQTAADVVDALGPWLPAPTTGSVVSDPVTRSDLAGPTNLATVNRPAARPPRPYLYAGGAGAAVLVLVGLVAFLWPSGSPAPVTYAPPPVAGPAPYTPPAQPPAQPQAQPARWTPPAAPAAAAAVMSPRGEGGRFQPVGFGAAASASAAGPLFAHNPGDAMLFEPAGEQTLFDVPFLLPDPGDRRNNILTFYGPISEHTRALPRSARVGVGVPVRALHFLSGVSAWGWPFDGQGSERTEKGAVTLIVRLEYADRTTEDHEWRNGEHFADYFGRHDVPGSEFAAMTRNDKQVRYIRLAPRRPDQVITAVEFVKGADDRTSPAVVAMTVERPVAGGPPPAPAPAPAAAPATGAAKPAAPAGGFIPLELRDAATAVLADPPPGGQWGTYTRDGVPFDWADPDGGRRPNAVRLAAGGPPARVPCFLAARGIHVLGTGGPVRARLRYAGGATEVVDLAPEPAADGPVRRRAAPSRDEAIAHIELEAAADAAVVVGVTVERL